MLPGIREKRFVRLDFRPNFFKTVLHYSYWVASGVGLYSDQDEYEDKVCIIKQARGNVNTRWNK